MQLIEIAFRLIEIVFRLIEIVFRLIEIVFRVQGSVDTTVIGVKAVDRCDYSLLLI